jgi:hypothetical protein
VCKHFASYQGYHNYKWNLIRYAKGYGEIVPVHATQEYSGRVATASLSLNRCTRQRRSVNSTLRPIYSREITPVPTEYSAGGHFGEKKIIFTLMGFEALTI